MTLLSRLLIVTCVSSALTVLLMLVYWEPETVTQPASSIPALAPAPAVDAPREPAANPAPREQPPDSPVRQA